MNVLKIKKGTGVLRWLVLGAGVCSACRDAPRLASYPSRALEGKIRAYAASDKGQTDHRKVLTVDSFTTGDTVRFEMYNTYPDSTGDHLLGYDTLGGFTVFFIGRAQKDYVRVNTTPHEATKRLRAMIRAKYGPAPVPGINYRTVVFTFVSHRLVD